MKVPKGSSRILKIRDEPLNPFVNLHFRSAFPINPVNLVNPVKKSER